MNFINNNEIVGRALFEPEWDGNTKRPSPSAFTRSNTSVTRKLDLEDAQLILLLKQDVEQKQGVIVKAAGLISVEKIKNIGLDSVDSKTYFEVKESPTEKNQNHAEVIPFTDVTLLDKKKTVSRGVSRKIGESLDLLVLNSDGDVVERLHPKP